MLVFWNAHNEDEIINLPPFFWVLPEAYSEEITRRDSVQHVNDFCVELLYQSVTQINRTFVPGPTCSYF